MLHQGTEYAGKYKEGDIIEINDEITLSVHNATYGNLGEFFLSVLIVGGGPWVLHGAYDGRTSFIFEMKSIDWRPAPKKGR
jgi:hypothetical protein